MGFLAVRGPSAPDNRKLYLADSVAYRARNRMQEAGQAEAEAHCRKCCRISLLLAIRARQSYVLCCCGLRCVQRSFCGALIGRPSYAVMRPAHTPQKRRAWTLEQTRIFLSAIAGHRHQLAWLLAVGMGLRRGEQYAACAGRTLICARESCMFIHSGCVLRMAEWLKRLRNRRRARAICRYRPRFCRWCGGGINSARVLWCLSHHRLLMQRTER